MPKDKRLDALFGTFSLWGGSATSCAYYKFTKKYKNVCEFKTPIEECECGGNFSKCELED